MTEDTPTEQASGQDADTEFVALLACPKCHESLSMVPTGLRCPACCCTYPVRDGVPVLLIEEAAQDQADADPLPRT